nr:OsmC family protein [Saprospiraceae bacterium]
MESHVYKVNLKWKNGRVGKLSASGLPTEFQVATPPEFDQGVPGIWSPEHLFTASVVSCFMTTFLAIAHFSGLEFKDFDCPADGKLEKVERQYQMTEILLRPTLTIFDEKFRAKANRILVKAESACLITHSIHTQVKLDPTILID